MRYLHYKDTVTHTHSRLKRQSPAAERKYFIISPDKPTLQARCCALYLPIQFADIFSYLYYPFQLFTRTYFVCSSLLFLKLAGLNIAQASGNVFPETPSTHFFALVIYTFAKIDNKNKITPYERNEDELYAEVYNIKQESIELKMLQAVGGWSHEGGPISPFSRMGSTASN